MRAITTTREGGAIHEGACKVLHDPLNLFLGPLNLSLGPLSLVPWAALFSVRSSKRESITSI